MVATCVASDHGDDVFRPTKSQRDSKIHSAEEQKSRWWAQNAGAAAGTYARSADWRYRSSMLTACRNLNSSHCKPTPRQCTTSLNQVSSSAIPCREHIPSCPRSLRTLALLPASTLLNAEDELTDDISYHTATEPT
jgi:hypothetical protein